MRLQYIAIQHYTLNSFTCPIARNSSQS